MSPCLLEHGSCRNTQSFKLLSGGAMPLSGSGTLVSLPFLYFNFESIFKYQPLANTESPAK